MGEIADMMLDGTMCQLCGVWLNEGEDGDGYPQYCAGCQPDEDDDVVYGRADKARPPEPRYACPVCDRKLKSYEGYLDHYRTKHGEANP